MILKYELPGSLGAQYDTGEEWRNNSRENEEIDKVETMPSCDVAGDGSKVRCCKEQYCIGTRNVRYMSQVKLQVVKQKMSRLNIDILETSELKWTEMGEFNSDYHYIFCCGQEREKKWSSPHSQEKSLKCSTCMQSRKQQNDLCWFPRQTIQYHSNPSLCPSQ